MRRYRYILLGVFILSQAVSLPGQVRRSVEQSLDRRVMEIFQADCSSCHGAKTPPKGMRLDSPAMVKQTVIDVPSKEREGLKRVDTSSPENSYLLMKISGHSRILGDRMPPAYPLAAGEIKAIRDWLAGLGRDSSPAGMSSQEKRLHTPFSHFQAQKVINLPTTNVAGKRQVSFLIAHRFYPELKSGFDSLFGLDGPSTIMFSLGYGLSDRLSLSLSRTNLNKVVQLGVHWKLLESSSSLPVEAVLHVGGGLVTRDIPERDLLDSRHIKLSAQLSLSYALSRKWSVLLVPAFVSNADHWQEDPEHTLSLGLGTRFLLGSGFALTAEYTPVISSYKDADNSWGFGIEKRMGKHVFQLFLLNSVGLTADQYLSGGDLKLSGGAFRLGFNIFRIF